MKAILVGFLFLCLASNAQEKVVGGYIIQGDTVSETLIYFGRTTEGGLVMIVDDTGRGNTSEVVERNGMQIFTLDSTVKSTVLSIDSTYSVRDAQFTPMEMDIKVKAKDESNYNMKVRKPEELPTELNENNHFSVGDTLYYCSGTEDYFDKKKDCEGRGVCTTCECRHVFW